MTANPPSEILDRSARGVLGRGEVHVVVADMDAPPRAPKTLYDSLSEAEVERAGRFHFAEHRDRYIVRRGLLRAMLGTYLGAAPAGIDVTEGPYGKPEVVSPPRSPGVVFNLSYSNRLAVYAFSRGRELGIDVERVRGDIDHRALASRFFAPGERAVLADVHGADLAEWFFACWTRKEAVVKAHGAGLSLPLDSFEVSVDPDVAPHLQWRTRGESDGTWRLETFRPRPGFIGSLAVHGEPARVEYRVAGDVLEAVTT